MRRVLASRERKSPRIDIVPLVDVLMVLIVFFLVTMQFRDLRAINVRLPEIETAGSNLLQNEIVLSVDREGNYYLNDSELSEQKLELALRAASRVPQKPKVLIVADEDVPLKKVTRLVDICRSNKLQDFRLQAR
ncbi:MAG: biopolymer transporter TolR [Opitutae bacterium]|nr:biopolymer transporter TolR [Opitutae bacterium]